LATLIGDLATLGDAWRRLATQGDVIGVLSKMLGDAWETVFGDGAMLGDARIEVSSEGRYSQLPRVTFYLLKDIFKKISIWYNEKLIYCHKN
jgi:hypothetical protein